MNLKQCYSQFGCLPNSFVLENGIRFEHTTMQHSDGTWYAYVYQMKGLLREHLYSFAIGSTEDEAIENLIIKNSIKQ